MTSTVPRRQPAVRTGTQHAPKSSLVASTAKKQAKYGNVPTTVDGRRFSSKREAARYQMLAAAQRAGAIADLQCQVPYDLHAPNGTKIGRYIADFTYRLVTGAVGTSTQGVTFVEDAKGVRTPLYRWKRRHVEAEYGITIIEV